MSHRVAMDESGIWRETQTGPTTYPIRNTVADTAPPATPCPGCGVTRQLQTDDEHGSAELCLTPSCRYDK